MKEAGRPRRIERASFEGERRQTLRLAQFRALASKLCNLPAVGRKMRTTRPNNFILTFDRLLLVSAVVIAVVVLFLSRCCHVVD